MTKEKNKQYYVYKITNIVNNKLYIGITINCQARWKKHCSQAKQKIKHALHWAILKYGEENFLLDQIEICLDWKEACEREKFWIKTLKEDKYQLYNETDGGDGSLGVRRYGKDNPNYGREMQQWLKQKLLTYRRKLSDEQIKEIRLLFNTGQYTQTKLAKQFNISLTQIHRIVHNKSWSDNINKNILTKRNMTLDDARDIKNLYATGKYTLEQLGNQYNCSSSHISKIIRGVKWKEA